MSTDAIVLLRNDHKEVRSLFREFTGQGTTDARKGSIVRKIIELLTVHTYIENEVMYPQVRKLLPDLEDDVLESYEEHHVADVLVMELDTLKPGDERFEAKAMVLIESVTHHMDEEEQDWFPKVREGLGRKKLQELGEMLIEAKRNAPRRPAQPSAMEESRGRSHLMTCLSPSPKPQQPGPRAAAGPTTGERPPTGVSAGEGPFAHVVAGEGFEPS